MKTEVQTYQPPAADGKKQYPSIPPVLRRLQKLAVSYAVLFLRLSGVSRITVKPSIVGIKSLTDVGFQELNETPPEELQFIKNFLLRHFAEFLVLFGIFDINMINTDQDLEELRTLWENLKKGELPDNNALQKTIPLNVEEDPSGLNILAVKPDA